MIANDSNLTVSEKRNVKLWQLMRDSNSFFSLKELEKLGTKCGIRSVCIKDTMKWLVDENMIMQNKMGSINIYWTLASEEYSMLDRKRHNLQNILTKESQNLLIEKERQTELIERVYDLSNKSDETTPKKDRKSKIPIDIEKLNHEQVSRQLDNVRLELTKYENMLSKMKIMELYSIESLKSQIELATIATQRWNDNILSVKCWFTKHVLNNN